MNTSTKNAWGRMPGGILAGVLILLGLGFVQAEADGPIEISSIDELQLIGTDPDCPLDGDYILTRDIDASDTEEGNEDAGFDPTLGGDEPFTGAFDSQGHVITYLFIKRPEEDYISLFGYVDEGGVIQNLGLEGGAVTGDDIVGGLVGLNDGGTVSQSYATGTVEGGSRDGGLVGGQEHGMVLASFWDTETTGQMDSCGGRTTDRRDDHAKYLSKCWLGRHELGHGRRRIPPFSVGRNRREPDSGTRAACGDSQRAEQPAGNRHKPDRYSRAHVTQKGIYYAVAEYYGGQ